MTEYKILGQSNPFIGDDLYSVPAGKSAAVRSINVTNTSSSDATYDIAIVEDGGAIQNRNVFMMADSSRNVYLSQDGKNIKYISTFPYTTWYNSSYRVSAGGRNGFISGSTYVNGNFIWSMIITHSSESDPQTWTTSTISPSLTYYPQSAVSSDSLAIITSFWGSYWSSTDLNTWNGSSYLLNFIPNLSNYNDRGISDAAFDGSSYVMPMYRSRLAASSTDGATWTTSTLASYRAWTDIAYGDGKFVVVGSYPWQNTNIFNYSTNGVTWTQGEFPSSSPWLSIEYGDGKFVVLGVNGAFAYSTDAVSWTVDTISGFTSGASVLRFADNKFFAIDGQYTFDTQVPNPAAYSTNGITWTQTTISFSNYIGGIAYGNGIYVVTPGSKYDNLSTMTDVLSYSTDLITWTSSTIPEGLTSWSNWAALAYGNGRFVSISQDTRAMYSTDAITWTASTLSFSNSGRVFLNFINGKFITTIGSAVYSSTDGITWTGTYADVSVPGISDSTAASYANGSFYFAAIQPKDFIVSSTDTITWQTITMPSSLLWTSVAHGNGAYVATSSVQQAAYSTDGITWSSITMPVGGIWHKVIFADNKFVTAVQYSSQYAYSTDGLTWSSATGPSSGGYRSIEYSNNIFMISSGSANVISTNGITWTASTLDKTISYGGPFATNIDTGKILTDRDFVFKGSDIMSNETVTIKSGYTLEENASIYVRSSNGASTFHAFGGEI